MYTCLPGAQRDVMYKGSILTFIPLILATI